MEVTPTEHGYTYLKTSFKGHVTHGPVYMLDYFQSLSDFHCSVCSLFIYICYSCYYLVKTIHSSHVK